MAAEIACTPDTCSTWWRKSREQAYTVHHCHFKNVSQSNSDWTHNSLVFRLLSLCHCLCLSNKKEKVISQQGRNPLHRIVVCSFSSLEPHELKALWWNITIPHSVKKVNSITGKHKVILIMTQAKPKMHMHYNIYKSQFIDFYAFYFAHQASYIYV